MGYCRAVINRSKNETLEAQNMIYDLYALYDYIKCGGEQ